MQMSNAHKLLDASSFRPFLLEVGKHPVGGQRPVLFPSSERFDIVKCARPLFKKWQVVKRIKNILFFLIASGMTGNEVCFIKDVNMEWIRLEDDFPSGTVHRNGVAVGFIGCLAVGS